MFNSVRYVSRNYLGKKEDSYEHVKMPYEDYGTSNKILFVLDHVPSEDLRSGKLFSGAVGDIFKTVVTEAMKASGVKRFSWLCCSYNAYRTYGKAKDYVENAHKEFDDRLRTIVEKYKPTTVVTFGARPTAALVPEQVELTDMETSPWFGVPIETKNGYKVVPSITLRGMSRPSEAEGSILGYLIRNLANALSGKLRYGLDTKTIEDHASKEVDTVEKFDKLMDFLEKHKGPVSIDTETDNLNRVVNKLLTVQFATSIKTGYVILLDHVDSPFTGKEKKYLKARLKKYFEWNNENEFHVFANASFDLNIFRSQLNIEHYKADVWDIFAGEFGYDENMKFLSSVDQAKYFYSLGNLAVQYGLTAYLTSPFSKDDRANFGRTAWDKDVQYYTTLDAVVPFGIMLLQKQRADDEHYIKYNSLVGNQFSDNIHGFSIMESTGSLVDIDYLFYLRSKGSPIEEEINKLTQQLLDSPAAKKANKKLSKKKNVQSADLFGGALGEQQFLDLSKAEHKQLLFFDILDLDPVETGKDGTGKLDKAFQEQYKDVPEVAAYTKIEKAKKLRNAYVKSLIKKLKESADFRLDKKIRSRYTYLLVVTGRASSKDPNMQQIPSRGALSKYIKRLFIAPDGMLYIKVDYRVHEVRGLGLVSGDKGLCGIFQDIKKMWDDYRINPDPDKKKKLKEADVHVVNAAYFFSKTVQEIANDKTKSLRNAVKNVVFGLIYQMSAKSMSRTIKQTLDFTENLMKAFKKRFPVGMKWIESMKKFGREHLYVENKFGFRRHLWGYLIDEAIEGARSIHGRLSRMSVNSPIQGMGAQMMFMGIRLLDKALFKIKRSGRNVKYNICNTVHDSLESTWAYEDLLLGLREIEASLTTRVREEIKKRHGWELGVDLEIDFGVGPALSEDHEWDFSLAGLEWLLFESLEFQRDELKREIEIDKTMNLIFSRFDEDAPAWMKKQQKQTGWKLMTYKRFLKVRAEQQKAEEEAKAAEEAKKKAEELANAAIAKAGTSSKKMKQAA